MDIMDIFSINWLEVIGNTFLVLLVVFILLVILFALAVRAYAMPEWRNFVQVCKTAWREVREEQKAELAKQKEERAQKNQK